MELPFFKYHPDPLATGSIKASDVTCACCGEARGFIYTASAYGEADLNHKLCPWCIASGDAARKFGAAFTDDFSFQDLPDEIVDEVVFRTPGFHTWQQEEWWKHCGDAGAYLGAADQITLEEAQIEQVTEALRATDYSLSAEEWRSYFQAPGTTGLTVYVFRCLHCNRFGGYWDCD